jgi:ABC-type dipeptide/oligopeptide/nickel transport system permease subunit
MGTSSNAYDIFYALFGNSHGMKSGFIIEIATLIIGFLVGSISAYTRRGRYIIMPLWILHDLPFILAAMIRQRFYASAGQDTLPSVIALFVFG